MAICRAPFRFLEISEAKLPVGDQLSMDRTDRRAPSRRLFSISNWLIRRSSSTRRSLTSPDSAPRAISVPISRRRSKTLAYM